MPFDLDVRDRDYRTPRLPHELAAWRGTSPHRRVTIERKRVGAGVIVRLDRGRARAYFLSVDSACEAVATPEARKRIAWIFDSAEDR